MDEPQEPNPVTRKMRISEDFIVGFLARGFGHKFKVVEGVPHDAKILNVKFDSLRQQIELTFESPSFKPEDEKKPLNLIIHETG
jgi:hypothetical protein